MENKALTSISHLAPKRDRNFRPIHRVEESKQGYSLSINLELLRCFVGDRAPTAIATQEIGAVRLDFLYFLDVEGSHVFNGCEWRLAPIQPLGLQSINWLIGQMAREATVYQYITASPVKQKQRRARAFLLNGNEGRPS